LPQPKAGWSASTTAPKPAASTSVKSLRQIQEEELQQQKLRQHQQEEQIAQLPKQTPTRLAGAWASPTITRQDMSLKQIQEEQFSTFPTGYSCWLRSHYNFRLASKPPSTPTRTGGPLNSWGSKPDAAAPRPQQKPLASSNEDENFWDYEEQSPTPTPAPQPAPAKTILAKPSAAKKQQPQPANAAGQSKRNKKKRTLDPSLLGFSVEGGPAHIDADDDA